MRHERKAVSPRVAPIDRVKVLSQWVRCDQNSSKHIGTELSETDPCPDFGAENV